MNEGRPLPSIDATESSALALPPCRLPGGETEMVLLSRCCCWRSVRDGSFASGIFTLAAYLIVMVSSVSHLTDIDSLSDATAELFYMNWVCVVISACCVVSSLVLFVGLTLENRLLLLPWVASVSMATGLDFAAALYLVPDAIEMPWVWILFATDLLFCFLSVYCVMCVVSQYQRLISERQPIPVVRFEASSEGISTVSRQVARRHNGLLAPPSPTSSKHNNTDTSSISDNTTRHGSL